MRNVEPQDVPAGAQLIDVREDHEWADGHAAGATHIPMGEIPDRVDELDKSRDIYLICKGGGRSAKTGQYLEGALDVKVVNVDGGTDAWRAADLPMED